MTTTEERIERQPLPASKSDAGGVLDILYDTLDVVSELDPDLLDSYSSAGRAVSSLAAAARAAAAALGAAPGIALGHASGVVVVRDLVAAVSLLELAASRRDGDPDRDVVEGVARRARTAHDQFLLAVPMTR
jgi:hypothetical protein